MTKSRYTPKLEISDERKEQLTSLAKYVVIPALGYLAARPLYVHKEKITGYVQYMKHDKGFTLGLTGLKEHFSEFSGRFTSDEDVVIESSNMDEEDIVEAEKIFSEVAKGRLEE